MNENGGAGPYAAAVAAIAGGTMVGILLGAVPSDNDYLVGLGAAAVVLVFGLLAGLVAYGASTRAARAMPPDPYAFPEDAAGDASGTWDATDDASGTWDAVDEADAPADPYAANPYAVPGAYGPPRDSVRGPWWTAGLGLLAFALPLVIGGRFVAHELDQPDPFSRSGQATSPDDRILTQPLQTPTGAPPTAVARPDGRCAGTNYARAVDEPAPFGLPTGKEVPQGARVTATMALGQGTVRMELFADRAPCTVASIVFLARHHVYDGTVCHRVTTEGIYVLQCGDPTGTGSGGPGYTLPEENTRGATYPAGTVAMAKTQSPHSGGSQFFVVYRDAPLPPEYTVFGRVTEGLDVIRAIAANGVEGGGTDGRPAVPVPLDAFTVTVG